MLGVCEEAQLRRVKILERSDEHHQVVARSRTSREAEAFLERNTRSSPEDNHRCLLINHPSLLIEREKRRNKPKRRWCDGQDLDEPPPLLPLLQQQQQLRSISTDPFTSCCGYRAEPS